MIPAKNRVYCPAPECSALLEAEEGSSPGPTECPNCHILMCSRCALSVPTALPYVSNTALCCNCYSGTVGNGWRETVASPAATRLLLSCPAGANCSGMTASTARRPRPEPRTRSSLTCWSKTIGDSARVAGTRQCPFPQQGQHLLAHRDPRLHVGAGMASRRAGAAITSPASARCASHSCHR